MRERNQIDRSGLPQRVDINGRDWKERPDYRIRQSLMKTLGREDYLGADRFIAEHNWYGLESFLRPIARSKEGEGKLRVNEAIDIAIDAAKQGDDFDD